MSQKYTGYLKSSITMALNLIRQDIENCSDEVWEKKAGGDYYWEHIYHSLILIFHGTGGKPQEYIKNAGMLNNKSNPSEPHSRALMLKVLADVEKYVDSYFSELKDEDLDKITDFHGMMMPFANILMILNSHVFYHLGICDNTLRENGLKGAI